ncbi:hypothetical protein N7486_004262 [Penicillium sp. IBT 16267x]|nr:hypothetical protein N7486_004262 [Penicillium sp. IBT 16267x]
MTGIGTLDKRLKRPSNRLETRGICEDSTRENEGPAGKLKNGHQVNPAKRSNLEAHDMSSNPLDLTRNFTQWSQKLQFGLYQKLKTLVISYSMRLNFCHVNQMMT